MPPQLIDRSCLQLSAFCGGRVGKGATCEHAAVSSSVASELLHIWYHLIINIIKKERKISDLLKFDKFWVPVTDGVMLIAGPLTVVGRIWGLKSLERNSRYVALLWRISVGKATNVGTTRGNHPQNARNWWYKPSTYGGLTIVLLTFPVSVSWTSCCDVKLCLYILDMFRPTAYLCIGGSRGTILNPLLMIFCSKRQKPSKTIRRK